MNMYTSAGESKVSAEQSISIDSTSSRQKNSSIFDIYFDINHDYQSTLFKIDESYKIVKSFDTRIIRLHEKVYEHIIFKNITLHPGIIRLFPNFLDDNNFFEDENNDIDVVCENINKLSDSISTVEKLFGTTCVTKDIFKLNNTLSNDLKITGIRQDYTKKATALAPSLLSDMIAGSDDSISGSRYYEINKYVHIVFNKYFLTTSFIKSDMISLKDLQTYFPELKILKTTYLNDETIEYYKSLFRHITDEKIISTKLNILLNKNNNSIWEGTPTFETIKLFLETTYTINHNIENRIQFSTIYNKIVQDTHIMNENDKTTLHKLLPIVLKDLGLAKKRYSTGIFWYGLILQNKESSGIISDMASKKQYEWESNELLSKKLDKLIMQREIEEKEFNENNSNAWGEIPTPKRFDTIITPNTTCDCESCKVKQYLDKIQVQLPSDIAHDVDMLKCTKLKLCQPTQYTQDAQLNKLEDDILIKAN